MQFYERRTKTIGNLDNSRSETPLDTRRPVAFRPTLTDGLALSRWNYRYSQQNAYVLLGARLAHFEGILHFVFTLLLGQSLRETSVYFSENGKSEVEGSPNWRIWIVETNNNGNEFKFEMELQNSILLNMLKHSWCQEKTLSGCHFGL